MLVAIAAVPVVSWFKVPTVAVKVALPKLLKVALPERSPPKVITGDLLIVTAEAISPPSIFSETPVPVALKIA